MYTNNFSRVLTTSSHTKKCKLNLKRQLCALIHYNLNQFFKDNQKVICWFSNCLLKRLNIYSTNIYLALWLKLLYQGSRPQTLLKTSNSSSSMPRISIKLCHHKIHLQISWLAWDSLHLLIQITWCQYILRARVA